MIYRFVIVSNEVPGFRRDIKIEAGAKFSDLCNIIQESVGYAKDQLSCFYICDDAWQKEKEVHIMDLRMNPEEDIYLMDKTTLDDLLTEEKQKLMYVFDMMGNRAFFVELREIIFEKEKGLPKVVRSEGAPPRQGEDIEALLAEEPTKKGAKASREDEFGFNDEFDDFEGTEFASLDELDEAGFGLDEDSLY